MVTLVATVGGGSMDLYSSKLAENLDVPKIYTDVYQRIAELFKVPLLSRTTMMALREDWRFIRQLKRVNGILHLPNHHLGRYGFFLKAPYILTVHDLIRYFDLKGYGLFIHRPNFRDKIYLSLDYRGIKKAARIIAISQATKCDLMHHLSIPEERIRVVYEGIDHRLFRPVPKRSFAFPYILYVGSEHPRKNLSGLLKAFSQLKQKRQFKDLKLVKVGKAGGPEANFREQTQAAIATLELRDEVVFAGQVDDEELVGLYSSASCLALPSFYEGFGFPALEAMACGCPAIVSNVASLPEVTGEAAIQVDPKDTDALAEAIEAVLTDERLRETMIDRGLQRAREFTWERTAEQTLEVYREVEKGAG